MKELVQILLLFCVSVTYGQGQYPFEKYPSVKYLEYKDWKIFDKLETEKRIHFTLTIPGFYENKDTLTIQLTSFLVNWDSSFVRIFRNRKQIQKMFEPMHFTVVSVYDALRTADIDGDKLSDVKVVISYMGNGLAAMNQRVIYLFQKPDGLFNKISFLDKMDANRPERDLDGDNQFEIITMTLNEYESHNYWTFNIYNYMNGQLINKNEKFGYPIMIQYLYRANYKVTDKIPSEIMKGFGEREPAYYRAE